MEPFTLPDKKGRYIQPNEGDSLGNVYATYNIDLESQKGKVLVSSQVKKLLTDADNANFAYATAIKAGTDKYFAVGGKVFSADDSTPLGTWSEETAGSEPNSGNTVMDAAYFDGLFLVSEGDDIKSWNGTTWASWWQTTLGQTALATGERHTMWVGADGNLYIVDDGTKVYRVTPTGTVTKTGNGSLDFSATNYEINCAVSNSTRSFIGTFDKTFEEAVIIEWDMSPGASTANKLHKIGAKGVRCLAVWQDIVLAVLSNGKIKYFNGSSFVEFENSIRFPTPDGFELDDNFIHPNGWAIIDDLPHFLATGRVSANTVLGSTQNTSYVMPFGIWCLDPSVGLYHRFALGTGASTQDDYGKMAVRYPGALYSLQNKDSKFLASYEYYQDDQTSPRSVLVYHDAQNTRPARGFLMTPYLYQFKDTYKTIEAYHKILESGEKVRVYYRHEKQEVLTKPGFWFSTTVFNITGTSLGIVKGDVAFIKMGPGSGQLLRVDNVEESATVTSITFTEANTFATAAEAATLDFLNFRFAGEINSLTKDYHEITIPSPDKKRKVQFLFEFQQNASNSMEMDYTIIS